MFGMFKLSHRHKLTKENIDKHGKVSEPKPDLDKENEILRGEYKKVKDETQRYALLLLQIFNGAEELKLLHQHRLDAVKDKKGPKAVMDANAAFNEKFAAFMDLCIKGKSPTDG